MALARVGIDLTNYATFNLQKLTRTQAEERLRILTEAEEAITRQDPSGKLTPRSDRELGELTDALGRANLEVLTKVTITRVEKRQYYHVEFNKDPADALVEKFNDMSGKITAMEQRIGRGAERGILQAIVEPPQDMEWYRAQTLSQMHAVLRGDLLDSLKHGYVANLNLISAARSMFKDPVVYGEILALHARAYDLYQDHIDFSRACESNILDNARLSAGSLSDVRRLLLQCGSKLDTQPANFLEPLNTLVLKEAERSLELYVQIDKASGIFLGKLTPLKQGIDAAVKTITKANVEVAELIKAYDSLLREKEALAVREATVQNKYLAFQDAKTKEHASRKVETRRTGFWFWTWWSSTTITEADLGSRELWDEYQSTKADSQRLAEKIRDLDRQLTHQLQNHSGAYSSKDDLQEAARALAGALMAVRALEGAVKIKQSQATAQIELIKKKLGNTSDSNVTNIEDTVNYLEMLQSKVLNAHAIWIQSHRGVQVMQRVRASESDLKTLVIEDLTKGGNKGQEAIQRAIKLMDSNSDDPMRIQELTDRELLALTER